MIGRLLFLLLLLSSLCHAQLHHVAGSQRPLMNLIPRPFPELVRETVPLEYTTIQARCLRCFNAYCAKHCEDCGLEWGTRTLRCFQYGTRIADVVHSCLLLESKATERMTDDEGTNEEEKGAAWNSMAYECRVCESRIRDYSHSHNLKLLHARPDPIPEWSNEETTRKHIKY